MNNTDSNIKMPFKATHSLSDEYKLQMGRTIASQIIASASNGGVIMSWGVIDGFHASEMDFDPALYFGVNGRLFHGWVVVRYNTGGDDYEIWLANNGEAKKVAENVYCNELADTIDRHIEQGEDPEEYQRWLVNNALTA